MESYPMCVCASACVRARVREIDKHEAQFQVLKDARLRCSHKKAQERRDRRSPCSICIAYSIGLVTTQQTVIFNDFHFRKIGRQHVIVPCISIFFPLAVGTLMQIRPFGEN
jgi:hypothetical protein